LKPCQISIVIVNFNVENFLQLCLSSVYKATTNLEAEIWVVDNHSSDNSVEMVKTRFPDVKLIVNSENLGFSKANNLAIAKSNGEFVLLLNPDTILAEDSLEKCIQFLNEQPEAGSLGARMLDGSGNFLPESKRGLPTPWVSFCKAFGLGLLFPKSERFGKYHLSYLSENETHEVDVLSGAFMLMRKSALDISGLLDENFFMYGEDVDLSYRIQKAGFKNFYFPQTTIIHFKGESTKRGSMSFMRHFYKAMLLFSQKHFSDKWMFSVFIYIGIIFRAIISLISRFFKLFGNLIIEFVVSFIGMAFIKNWWELNFKGLVGIYPDFFIQLLIPVYLFVWIGSTKLVGRFTDRYGHEAIIIGIAIGTIIISGVTNFFDDYRFSKGLILIGAVWTYLIVTIRYIIGQFYLHGKPSLKFNKKRRWIIAGQETDFGATSLVLKKFEDQILIAGWISENTVATKNASYLGNCSELNTISYRLGLDQLLFCLQGVSSKSAISIIDKFKNSNLKFSFLAPDSTFIVSSSDKHDKGQVLQSENIPTLILPFNLRKKRLSDLIICFLILFIWPLAVLRGNSISNVLTAIMQVFSGKKSWVGLAENRLKAFGLKDGIITMRDLAGLDETPALVESLDKLYCEEFYIEKEIWTVLKNLEKI
jgi:GT2 family glycosyltransferase